MTGREKRPNRTWTDLVRDVSSEVDGESKSCIMGLDQITQLLAAFQLMGSRGLVTKYGVILGSNTPNMTVVINK